VAVRGALVFIASDSPQNSNWLGPAEPEAIAQQIAEAVGPSGANCEYVYRLAEALREVGAAQSCPGRCVMSGARLGSSVYLDLQ